MLYNKYRPKNFDEIVGQISVVENLRQQAIRGRFFSTYILCGQFGSGKTTTARILAAAINCKNKDKNGNPCCDCPDCRAIIDGNAPDVVEYAAAVNTGIDGARSICDQATFLPQTMRKKVFIIDEVQSMSKQAFNCLLKLFEEPPEHCVFILCTTEVESIPATIRSRSAIYYFAQLSEEDMFNHILEVADKENLNITDEAALLIAKNSEGSMRNALSLLETATQTGEATVESVNKLLGASTNKEKQLELIYAMVTGAIDKTVYLMKEQLKNCSSDILKNALINLVTELLVNSVAPELSFDTASNRELLNKFQFGKEVLIDISSRLINSVNPSPDTLLLICAGIAKTNMSAAISKDAQALESIISTLSNRVEYLEEKLNSFSSSGAVSTGVFEESKKGREKVENVPLRTFADLQSSMNSGQSCQKKKKGSKKENSFSLTGMDLLTFFNSSMRDTSSVCTERRVPMSEHGEPAQAEDNISKSAAEPECTVETELEVSECSREEAEEAIAASDAFDDIDDLFVSTEVREIQGQNENSESAAAAGISCAQAQQAQTDIAEEPDGQKGETEGEEESNYFLKGKPIPYTKADEDLLLMLSQSERVFKECLNDCEIFRTDEETSLFIRPAHGSIKRILKCYLKVFGDKGFQIQGIKII